MILKVKKDLTVTLTKEVLSTFSLTEGDLLDCIVWEGGIHLFPVKLPRQSELTNEISSEVIPVHVTMFGQFNIRIHNEHVLISNKKAKELLAYLLLHNGTLFLKRTLAELLWPQISSDNAMGNLYKVIRFFKSNTPLNTYFPLTLSPGKIGLTMDKLSCDFLSFERAFSQFDNIKSLKKAVDLYKGPILFEEYYEWTAEKEAYYEIRYTEMVEHLVSYYKQLNNETMTYYYLQRL